MVLRPAEGMMGCGWLVLLRSSGLVVLKPPWGNGLRREYRFEKRRRKRS